MNYHPRKEDNQRLIAIARGISYADVKEGNFQNMVSKDKQIICSFSIKC